LLEVQEVLGDREFEIGRFYFLRESYPASIARLQTLVEKYPLYSKADEAEYLLGQDYEGQITRLRAAPTCDAHGLPRGCTTEAIKGHYVEELTKHAAEAYGKILTRYPMMDRADDAKKRLAALHQPIPRPTKAQVAQNKAEEDSRHETTMAQKLFNVVKKGPDTSQTVTTGEPSLVETEPLSAPEVVRREAVGSFAASSGNKVGVEVINPSGDAAPPVSPDPNASPASPFGKTTANAQPGGLDPNELKPNAAPDSNELKPNDGTDPTLPPPAQVNEIQSGPNSPATVIAADNTPATDQEISSSKKKKKKGLKKLNPF
jgi:outer membrane protein assembly factor BamD